MCGPESHLLVVKLPVMENIPVFGFSPGVSAIPLQHRFPADVIELPQCGQYIVGSEVFQCHCRLLGENFLIMNIHKNSFRNLDLLLPSINWTTLCGSVTNQAKEFHASSGIVFRKPGEDRS